MTAKNVPTPAEIEPVQGYLDEFTRRGWAVSYCRHGFLWWKGWAIAATKNGRSYVADSRTFLYAVLRLWLKIPGCGAKP